MQILGLKALILKRILGVKNAENGEAYLVLCSLGNSHLQISCR